MKPCSVTQRHGWSLPVFNDRRWLGFDFICRGMVVYDQPRTALARKKCPDPLNKNADAEIGSGEELDMDQCPPEPGEESAQMNLAALHDGKAFANHCHV